ncbi:MAG: GNAT family N-acetyltransferase [Candidatus Shapirobacteria bacterium]|nr:GNAT family N-acetyltransferase [Candidatus Shapirobacteria bacterium]
MDKLKINQAGPDDIPIITKIKKAVWLDIYPNLGLGVTKKDILALDFELEESRRRQNMTKPNWRYWLARIDNEPVGYLAAKKEDSQGIIKLVHVLSSYRGKGIGTALFNQALEWLAGKRIRLQVVGNNSDAIEFYRKFGFSFMGRGRPIKIAGKKIDAIKMVVSNT